MQAISEYREFVDKLNILFFYQCINFPVLKSKINELIMENDLLEYFTILEYTDDLINNGMLQKLETESGEHLLITQKGSKSLEVLADKISETNRETIIAAVEAFKKEYEHARTFSANHTKDENDNYNVNLKITDFNNELMSLNIKVPTNKIANRMCKLWQDDAIYFYGKIIDLFENADF